MAPRRVSRLRLGERNAVGDRSPTSGDREDGAPGIKKPQKRRKWHKFEQPRKGNMDAGSGPV
ncbi:MAG: hypothetical protein ACI9KE_005532 [Polyangiales bacterium]|jgi:hypothetical protein